MAILYIMVVGMHIVMELKYVLIMIVIYGVKNHLLDIENIDNLQDIADEEDIQDKDNIITPTEKKNENYL